MPTAMRKALSQMLLEFYVTMLADCARPIPMPTAMRKALSQMLLEFYVTMLADIMEILGVDLKLRLPYIHRNTLLKHGSTLTWVNFNTGQL